MRTRILAIAVSSCLSLTAAYAKESDGVRSEHVPSTRMKAAHHSSSLPDSARNTDDDSETTVRSSKGHAHAGKSKTKHRSEAQSSSRRKRDKKNNRRTEKKNSDEPSVFDIYTPVDLPSHENENLEDGVDDETQDDNSASGNLIPLEDQNGGGP